MYPGHTKAFYRSIILRDIELTKKDIYDSMKSIENNKSPENDGLTKEFYVTFWDDIKATFVKYFSKAGNN